MIRTRRPFVVGLVQRLDDVGLEQRAVDGDGPPDVAPLGLAGLVVVDHQTPGGGAAVAGPLQHLEQHGVADREAGTQRLGLPVSQPIEGLLVPVGVPALGRLLLAPPSCAFRSRMPPSRRPADSRPRAAAPGPTRSPWSSNPFRPARPAICLNSRTDRTAGGRTVVLAELGEQHRPDRDVDPDAQRVGAADELEQPLAGQIARPAGGTWAAGRRDGSRSRGRHSGAGPCRSVCRTGSRPTTSRTCAFSSLVRTSRLIRFWACSAAARCVKCTM